MRLTSMLLFALCAPLAACDPAVDALGHPAPEACEVPAVGDPCPRVGSDAESAERLLMLTAACLDGERLEVVRVEDLLEVSCIGAGGMYRYQAGYYAPGLGVSYLAADGTLILCGEDGEVYGRHALLTDGELVWRAVALEDLHCLGDTRPFPDGCELVSSLCGV